jgi:photosynthetic reaction center cytochrome c subunit
MSFGTKITACVIGVVLLAIVLVSFERPPVVTVQSGFNGLGMEQVYRPPALARLEAANQVPASLPQIPAVGPTAGQTYQNVQVLRDLSVGEFTRLMASITQWVAPTEGPNAGCNYCHVAGNLASDDVYTKIVSRRMLQMNRQINEQWASHVAPSGVTCYTCHRGQPVPRESWARNLGPNPTNLNTLGALRGGQNIAMRSSGYASLPFDSFSMFFAADPAEIRMASRQIKPGNNPNHTMDTEWTYALMMNFSQALGVNCTYCHNSRNFQNWEGSPPTRAVAWHGIRMVRDINVNFMDPLLPAFSRPDVPEGRLGKHGDVLKVNCATCHQGAYKPLLGQPMAAQHPELNRVSLQ